MDFQELIDIVYEVGKYVAPILIRIVVAVIVWVVGSKVIKVLQSAISRAFQRASVDVSISKFMQSLISFATKVILVVTIVDILGVPTSSFITILGTLGLTIGLSLQGSLSNFAGGVLLLVFRPFKVGDYIIEDSHKNEGTVLAIDLLYTKLLTGDNRTVIIPNGTLANTSLTNVSAQKIRRMDINIGISYDSDLLAAKNILSDIIDANELVLQNKEKQVFVKSLDADCVLLETRMWVKSEDYWNLRWRLLEEYKMKFTQAGIEIPFRQLDVKIKQ